MPEWAKYHRVDEVLECYPISNKTHPHTFDVGGLMSHKHRDCAYDNAHSPAMHEALDGIMHYHARHTSDNITRWVDRGSLDKNAPVLQVVYVTKDPEWIRKFENLTASEFPKSDDPALHPNPLGGATPVPRRQLCALGRPWRDCRTCRKPRSRSRRLKVGEKVRMHFRFDPSGTSAQWFAEKWEW